MRPHGAVAVGDCSRGGDTDLARLHRLGLGQADDQDAFLIAGFDLVGYCNQASFLLGNGLQQRLEEAEARADETRMQRFRNEARHLTLPSEMGERFQVMGFARDVEFGVAFLLGDQTWRL